MVLKRCVALSKRAFLRESGHDHNVRKGDKVNARVDKQARALNHVAAESDGGSTPATGKVAFYGELYLSAPVVRSRTLI